MGSLLPDLQDKVGAYQRLWTSLPAPSSWLQALPLGPVSTYPSQRSFRDPQPCSPRPPSYPRHGAPHPHPASPPPPPLHPILAWAPPPASHAGITLQPPVTSPEPTSAPRSHPWRTVHSPGPSPAGAVSRPEFPMSPGACAQGLAQDAKPGGRSDQHPTALKRVPRGPELEGSAAAKHTWAQLPSRGHRRKPGV